MSVLEECFSNFNVHTKSPRDLVKIHTHSESVGWCLKFSISKKLPNNINAAGSTDHNLSSKALEENGFQDVELKKKKKRNGPKFHSRGTKKNKLESSH